MSNDYFPSKKKKYTSERKYRNYAPCFDFVLIPTDTHKILEGNELCPGLLRLHDGKYIKLRLVCPMGRLCIKSEN